jgi:hypothetical protein
MGAELMTRLCFLLTLFAIAAICGACSLASDDALIRNFHTNQAKLEKLAAMAQEDKKVVRIAPDYTALDDNLNWPRPILELGFSPERWEEYKQLFRETGLAAGLLRRDSHILFLASSIGMGNGHGASKGYLFTTGAITQLPVMQSLDVSIGDAGMAGPGGSTFVRPIAKNWYLFRE